MIEIGFGYLKPDPTQKIGLIFPVLKLGLRLDFFFFNNIYCQLFIYSFTNLFQEAQFHNRTIIHIFKENPNPILSKKSIIKQPKFINPSHPILSRKSIIKTWILIIKQPKFINLFIGLKKKKKSPNHYKVYKLWLHPQA